MPSFMKNGDRIVGGQDALSPIPWQITKQYGCGGTILDSTTILSAAHCPYYVGEWIRAGSLKRYSGGQVCLLGLGRTLPELEHKYNFFNPRSKRLHKSSKILTYLTTVMIMTMLSSNWTVHSSWTMMFKLHVCHPQTHPLDWLTQKNNASQAVGEFWNGEVCSKHKNISFIP